MDEVQIRNILDQKDSNKTRWNCILKNSPYGGFPDTTDSTLWLQIRTDFAGD